MLYPFGWIDGKRAEIGNSRIPNGSKSLGHHSDLPDNDLHQVFQHETYHAHVLQLSI